MTRDLARWPLRLASLLACLLFWQLAARHKLDLLLLTFTYVPTRRGARRCLATAGLQHPAGAPGQQPGRCSPATAWRRWG
jgi:hypothetical protein